MGHATRTPTQATEPVSLALAGLGLLGALALRRRRARAFLAG